MYHDGSHDVGEMSGEHAIDIHASSNSDNVHKRAIVANKTQIYLLWMIALNLRESFMRKELILI